MMGFKIKTGRLSPKKKASFGVKKPFTGKKDTNRRGNTKPTLKKEIVEKKCNLRDDVSVRVEDSEYMAYLHALGLVCFCCRQQRGIELHHIKGCSSDEKNDREVIPLCGIECHRLGVELSAHGTAKKFREVFALEVQLKFARELYRNYKESLC